MVDLVITPASVVAGNDASIDLGAIAGETITAGKAVYQNLTTGKWMLADNNAATPPEAKSPQGIALNGASLNQPLAVQRGGDIVIGATLVPGDSYYLGDTPGGICPRADILTGESVTIMGIARNATTLRIEIVESGVTL